PTPTCRCPQSRSASRMTWTTRPSMAATGATGKRHGPTPDDKQHLKNNTAMVILIGNQKGGAGKSTLTLLLANDLTAAQQRKVTDLDSDYQPTVSATHEKARVPENVPPNEVIPAHRTHSPMLLQVPTKSRDETVLLDLPGKMDDDGLTPVILSG